MIIVMSKRQPLPYVNTVPPHGPEPNGLEYLRPVYTSNSEPDLPAKRRRNFLQKFLKSDRPISKTDIVPLEDQRQETPAHVAILDVPVEEPRPQQSATEQDEAIRAVEVIFSHFVCFPAMKAKKY